MQKPNYPRNIGREFAWIFKSEWGSAVNMLLVAILAVSATIYASPDPSLTPSPNSTAPHPWFPFVLIACLIGYAITTWFSIWKDAYRRKYDPTLALKYTDIFFKDNKEEKHRATEVLIRFHQGTKKWKDIENSSEIEPVLDVLDDIGFLLQGYQISDWVVYQYFSFWIQLYYEASREYIEMVRNDNTTIYEHIPPLYEDMMKIEAHNTKKPESELTFGEGLLEALRRENSTWASSNTDKPALNPSPASSK